MYAAGLFSKNKKDLRNIEEITREIRDLRNMSDENENLNSQVNELKVWFCFYLSLCPMNSRNRQEYHHQSCNE